MPNSLVCEKYVLFDAWLIELSEGLIILYNGSNESNVKLAK